MNEEELKKGCGKEFYTHDRIILVKCGTECKHDKRKSNQIHLCTTCQARLEYFQKGKLEILNKLNETYPDLKTQEDRKIFVKWKEQLQKEIGEEKQDE